MTRKGSAIILLLYFLNLIIITKAMKRRVDWGCDYRESVLLEADIVKLIEDGLGAARVSTFVSPGRERPL